jgi:hypothetical protein
MRVADNLDQRTLAQLWELENAGDQDRRAELAGDQFLSLFIEKLGKRSYVFRHGLDSSSDGYDVGDAEYWMYDTGEQAEIAFAQLLGEARAEGRLVDEDSDAELGDPYTEAPETTEVGEENLDLP